MEAVQLSGRAAQGVVQNLQFRDFAKFTVAYRLLRAKGFDHVIRAENVANLNFKIFFAPNSDEHARLGIVASKKTLPRAVDRNRFKRMVREVFRQHNIKICKLDLVVMVRRDYSQKVDMRIDNLKRLFSQVEHRCAE